jgi:leucyl aminopeptidase
MANLAKEPVTIEIENGCVLSFVVLDKKNNTFQRHTLIRKALQPLIAENPEVLSISVFGDEVLKEINARAAVYVALMNSQILPNYKKETIKKNIKSIELFGTELKDK